ncbi:hypothetical protein CEXT_403891 [Caerostris extrusa]|uniref:Uncharacterized protein n=1 Tax=Caerostris extrusa TaxID=172846 RepID=A0AAV4RLW1_CAEEX|nr:hypothetical protein CEXT_403891 [Caerostris extrusa]
MLPRDKSCVVLVPRRCIARGVLSGTVAQRGEGRHLKVVFSTVTVTDLKLDDHGASTTPCLFNTEEVEAEDLSTCTTNPIRAAAEGGCTGKVFPCTRGATHDCIRAALGPASPRCQTKAVKKMVR